MEKVGKNQLPPRSLITTHLQAFYESPSRLAGVSDKRGVRCSTLFTVVSGPLLLVAILADEGAFLVEFAQFAVGVLLQAVGVTATRLAVLQAAL